MATCVSEFISFTHEIYKNFDYNSPADKRGTFLDISTAFYNAWYKGLKELRNHNGKLFLCPPQK